MRIAVDATPLVGAGTGVATFTRGAIGALARQSNIDLTAYGLTLRGRAALARAVPDGVAVVGRPMPATLLTRLWAAFDGPAAEWWTGSVDVVHGLNFVVPPTRHAAQVVTVYDLTAVRFPELCAPASLRYPELVRRAVKRGAWVHTLAQAIAEEVVEDLGVDPDRVRVVPSGLDTTVVGPGGAGRGREVAGADRYLLAVGTVEPRKGLPDLVRAFDAVAGDRRDVRLVVAGPDGWGTAAFAAAVRAATHGDRVVPLGWVDASRRDDLLAGASALVMPSLYEGFGYPALEAMSKGVPVIATAVGSLPEVIGHAGRLVPAGDGDALAGALADVLDDPEGARAWASAGPARAATFSWSSCAEGLAELYADAMAAPR